MIQEVQKPDYEKLTNDLLDSIDAGDVSLEDARPTLKALMDKLAPPPAPEVPDYPPAYGDTIMATDRLDVPNKQAENLKDFGKMAVGAIPRLANTIFNKLPAEIASRINGVPAEDLPGGRAAAAIESALPQAGDPRSVFSKTGGMVGLAPLGLLGKAALPLAMGGQGAGQALEESRSAPAGTQAEYVLGQTALNTLMGGIGPVGAPARAAVTSFLKEAGQSGATMLAYSFGNWLTRKTSIEPDAKISLEDMATDVLAGVAAGQIGHGVAKTFEPDYKAAVEAAAPGLDIESIAKNGTVPYAPPDIAPKFPEQPPDTTPVVPVEKPQQEPQKADSVQEMSVFIPDEQAGKVNTVPPAAEPVKADDFHTGNKAVDSNQKPIELYHGTQADFESVDLNRPTRGYGEPLFFLTPNKDTAIEYANAETPNSRRQRDAESRLEDAIHSAFDEGGQRVPYDPLPGGSGHRVAVPRLMNEMLDEGKISRETYDKWDAAEDEYYTADALEGAGGQSNVMKFHASLKNPLEVDLSGMGKGARWDVVFPILVRDMIAGGHDGIIARNVYDSPTESGMTKPGDVYVVRDSKQVRLLEKQKVSSSGELLDIQKPQPEPTPAVEPTESAPTGIKNRIVNEELAAAGLPEVTKAESSSFAGANEEAARLEAADPAIGKKTVDRFAESPSAPSPVEDLILIRERNRLRIERGKVAKELESGVTDELLAKARELDAEYFKASQVSDTVGHESSISLGHRRAEMKEDYSLANLVYEYTVRNEIHPDQVAGAMEGLKKTAAEYEAKRAALDAQEIALKEREAKVAAEEQLKSAGIRIKREGKRPSAATKWLTVKADEARARIKARSTQASAGLDPAWIADYAVIAAEHISKGIDAGAALVKEFGEHVKPHLDEILEKAKTVQVDRFKEAMQGKELNRLRPLILKLQDHFYRQGIHEVDPMIDAIHGVLKEVKPETTRTQAMHLLGGYGDFKPLSKDPVEIGKREQRTTAQLWSKLGALLNKNPLLKSGAERPELTSEQRADLKKINKLKKELGIGALDPETQLKSTLEANKTRYRNALEDMQRQIDNLEADEVARGPGPTDAELQQLKADYSKKKAEFEDIFGKSGPTDAERLAKALEHAEKSAVETEARVKVADIAVRAKAEAQGPPTAEVDALRQKLEAARSRRDAAQAELRYLRSTNEQNVIAGLEQRIADVKAGVKKAAATGATVDTAKVAELRAELADLVKQRDAKPRRDPYEVAKQASLTRMATATARLHEKAMYKDFSPRTKKPALARDAAWEQAAAEFEQVKKGYEKQKHDEEMANRTNAQKFRALAKDVFFEPVRAIKTAWDLSAPGRQGIVFALANPRITATEHIPQMLSAFRSEESAAQIDAALRRRPTAKLGEMAKLDLTNHGDKLTHREEEIASRVLAKIPGFKGSNRAYMTFLNVQRATMFDMMIGGHPEAMTLTKAKAIAHAVNVGTGRGEAAKLAPAMGLAAHVLWAPKLLLSRMQILTAEPMWKADAAVRKQIATEMYLRPLGSVAALMALGAMSGGSIETDPRSTDFLKIKFGNTRIDILGGLMQIPVMLTKLLTGKTKDPRGRVQKDSRGAWDELTNFFRKKLAPVPGMAIDIAERKNVVGDPVTLTGLIASTVTPLSWKDMEEAAKEEGIAKGVLFGMMSIFGLGVQTYDPLKQRERPGSFWR